MQQLEEVLKEEKKSLKLHNITLEKNLKTSLSRAGFGDGGFNVPCFAPLSNSCEYQVVVKRHPTNFTTSCRFGGWMPWDFSMRHMHKPLKKPQIEQALTVHLWFVIWCVNTTHPVALFVHKLSLVTTFLELVKTKKAHHTWVWRHEHCGSFGHIAYGSATAKTCLTSPHKWHRWGYGFQVKVKFAAGAHQIIGKTCLVLPCWLNENDMFDKANKTNWQFRYRRRVMARHHSRHLWMDCERMGRSSICTRCNPTKLLNYFLTIDHKTFYQHWWR